MRYTWYTTSMSFLICFRERVPRNRLLLLSVCVRTLSKTNTTHDTSFFVLLFFSDEVRWLFHPEPTQTLRIFVSPCSKYQHTKKKKKVVTSQWDLFQVLSVWQPQNIVILPPRYLNSHTVPNNYESWYFRLKLSFPSLLSTWLCVTLLSSF